MSIDVLGLRQNIRHFGRRRFKYKFVNENSLISIKKSPWSLLLSVQLAILFQIMYLHRPGDKPSLDLMMV